MTDFSEIERLAAQGKKIHAIKEFRAVTRVGLKEAKEAVEWFQSHGQWPQQYRAQASAPPPSPSPVTPFAEAERWATKGKKIQAIKAFRAVTPAGLKDAKEAVEWFQSHGQWPEQYLKDAQEEAKPEPKPERASPLAILEQYMAQGKKIQAIKELRALTGWGLKDSKQAVDEYQARQWWPRAVLDALGQPSASPAPAPPPAPAPTPSAIPAAPSPPVAPADPDQAAMLAELTRHLGRPPDVRLAVRAQRVPYEGYLVMLSDRACFIRKDRSGRWMLDPVVPVFWYAQITAVDFDTSLGTDLHISMGHIHEWLSGLDPKDAEAALALFRVLAP